MKTLIIALVSLVMVPSLVFAAGYWYLGPGGTIGLDPIPPVSVPEPSTLILLAIGMSALWAKRYYSSRT